MDASDAAPILADMDASDATPILVGMVASDAANIIANINDTELATTLGNVFITDSNTTTAEVGLVIGTIATINEALATPLAVNFFNKAAPPKVVPESILNVDSAGEHSEFWEMINDSDGIWRKHEPKAEITLEDGTVYCIAKHETRDHYNIFTPGDSWEGTDNQTLTPDQLSVLETVFNFDFSEDGTITSPADMPAYVPLPKLFRISTISSQRPIDQIDFLFQLLLPMTTQN